MHEDIQFLLDAVNEAMQNSLSHLEKELSKIRAGKANPMILNGVMVEYYGSMTPLNQVATVTAPDPRMLMVSPFEKSMLGGVERAIIEANLGLNPSNDGAIIRVPIPALTEDRRRDLVKQAKGEGENAKISIRNSRRDCLSDIKKLKDDGVSEDMIKRGEDETQKITDKYTKQVDDILDKKESEIMTI